MRGHGLPDARRFLNDQVDAMTFEPEQPSLRIAHASDAPGLTELAKRSFSDTFADRNTPEDMAAYLGEHLTLERVEAELREPGSITLIAERGDRMVGFARLEASAVPPEIRAANPRRLGKLYVDTASIGSGVGALLMQACIDRARSEGRDALFLGVWEHNLRAVAFYERWGFRRVGTEVFVLGSDAQTDFLMVLPLTVASP